MLSKLKELVEGEKILDILCGLGDYEWDSLVINRRKPHTYRIFTQIGDIRLCLHKFDACAENESFYHPHPWPGAFYIVKGSYDMKVGRSKDRESDPVDVASFTLTAGSYYEITDPLTWHSVIPTETTYTIMINGQPFSSEVAHESVRTTKGKDLQKLSNSELEYLMDKFAYMLGG